MGGSYEGDRRADEPLLLALVDCLETAVGPLFILVSPFLRSKSLDHLLWSNQNREIDLIKKRQEKV